MFIKHTTIETRPLLLLVLIIITVWERFSKRVGAPAALGIPYVREERG